jgi:RHS repeat-associated protein
MKMESNHQENLPQPPQPFKFIGQFGVMTEPNGFYYMRARYYDPELGRFISEDPIGFGGGDVNLYAYVASNPTMFFDPSGLWTLSFGVTISGGLGLGGGGGTFLNIGHDPRAGAFSGWSFSITGTAGGGAFAGSGGSVQGVAQYTNASNVSQLEGVFLAAGASAGVLFTGGVEFITGGGGDVKGVSLNFGTGIKSNYASPISQYAFGTTTSTIVQYQQDTGIKTFLSENRGK